MHPKSGLHHQVKRKANTIPAGPLQQVRLARELGEGGEGQKGNIPGWGGEQATDGPMGRPLVPDPSPSPR